MEMTRKIEDLETIVQVHV